MIKGGPFKKAIYKKTGHSIKYVGNCLEHDFDLNSGESIPVRIHIYVCTTCGVEICLNIIKKYKKSYLYNKFNTTYVKKPKKPKNIETYSIYPYYISCVENTIKKLLE